MTVRDAHSEALAIVQLEAASFRRVELRDPTNWVEFIVEPGAPVALSIEGSRDFVGRVRTRVDGGTLLITLAGSLTEKVRDALRTSLTRRRLTYRLRAPDLIEVAVLGMVQVTVDAFGTDRPVVTRLEPAPPQAPHPGSPS
jgi:hypothetical protein